MPNSRAVVMRGLRCAAAILAVCACQPSDGDAQSPPANLDNGSSYFPSTTWRAVAPAAARFDTSRLRTVLNGVAAGQYGAIDGLLVARWGYLAVEQYQGWSPAQPHTMQSVTKSVTSLLFGILNHEAPAVTTSRKVLDLFPRYTTVANVDARKQALTVRDLLTMRTSMDFWEQPYPGSPLDQLNRSAGDWVKFVLDRPMTGTPGTTWAYNSGAAITIGGLIRDVSGENVDSFARHKLFAPVGITGETWARSPFDGLPHTGGGLFLKPLDLLRIGYLVLREGRWGDQQVVPRQWLVESTQPISRGNNMIFNGFNPGYGYFWWIFPRVRGGQDADVITASGSGGQWLFIVPKLDLVIAIVASNGAGLDLLYDILPAVK